jgi:hypothetical protein
LVKRNPGAKFTGYRIAEWDEISAESVVTNALQPFESTGMVATVELTLMSKLSCCV